MTYLCKIPREGQVCILTDNQVLEHSCLIPTLARWIRRQSVWKLPLQNWVSVLAVLSMFEFQICIVLSAIRGRDVDRRLWHILEGRTFREHQVVIAPVVEEEP